MDQFVIILAQKDKAMLLIEAWQERKKNKNE